ncbi:MAG: hypothetical protein MZV70_49915 [Desulfobacterales bacterium]|nr:hypothetical protein [Desulfobacterales bacterium]
MHVSNLCEIAYLVAYAASTVIVLGAGAGLTGLIVVLFALRCGADGSPGGLPPARDTAANASSHAG